MYNTPPICLFKAEVNKNQVTLYGKLTSKAYILELHAYLIYLFPINTELVNPLEEYADFIAKVEWVSAYINTHTIRDLRQSSAMGWRYNAGLALIGAFVLIWVSSAEITQVCINVFYVSIFFFLSYLPLFSCCFLYVILLCMCHWLCFEDVVIL